MKHSTAGVGVRAGAGVGTAFGTFGELLQGVLPEEDGDFLVTLPIRRWATARFELDGESRELTVFPEHKTKALRLASMMLDGGGGGVLRIRGTLPEGKGFASSSADLVATARAVAEALGEPLAPGRIESYLARIEPTDGVMHSSVVAFHHRSVRLRARLGSLPELAVVGVDEGGTVDTVAFNALPKPFTERDKHRYAELLDRVTRGVARGDLAEVGRVATASARMNQVLRYKRWLEPMVRVCEEVGGLGVVAAHSGTALGILLDPAASGACARLAATVRACREFAGDVTVYRTLSFA